jgi:hypothetical protein
MVVFQERNITMTINNNPFLTRDVYSACDQARVDYLDAIWRKQSGRCTKAELEASLRQNEENIDKYYEAAMTASAIGNIQGASAQLARFVMGWALWKADQDLVNAKSYLDPTRSDIAEDFEQLVQQNVVYWATSLQNKFHDEAQKRKMDIANIYIQRQAELFGGYQQVIQSQGASLHQAHQENLRYADVAIRGVQQVQQGAQWMMNGVAQINQQNQQGIQWMMKGVQGMYTHGAQVMAEAVKTQRNFTKTVEQNLPREWEKSQARTERRRILTKGIIAMVLITAVPLAIGLAWFLLKFSLGF